MAGPGRGLRTLRAAPPGRTMRPVGQAADPRSPHRSRGHPCRDALAWASVPLRHGSGAWRAKRRPRLAAVRRTAYLTRNFSSEAHHGPAKRRDHRACRPRQDDSRRSVAPPVGRVPRESVRGRARAGLGRPRAGEGHHHPRQGDLGRMARHADQHRGHARPRRFRGRGRADPLDGGRGRPAGGRGRGPDAADEVRDLQGPGPRPAPDRGAEQGRQARRRARPGPQRGVRPLRCARRRRGSARLPCPLRLGPLRLGRRGAGRPAAGPRRALRPDPAARPGPPPAERGGSALPDARHHAGGGRLHRPDPHGPDRVGPAPGGRSHQGADPRG